MKERRINTVHWESVPTVTSIVIGVGLPQSNITTLLIAIAFFGVVVMMLRLRRRARADHAARLEAERQAALADNLQQLGAAVWRARTPAAVIETCLPEFLHVMTAAAGAVIVLDDNHVSGDIVRAAGCDDPLPKAPIALATYPSLENVAGRQTIAAFDAPSGPDAGRVAVLDSLAAHRIAVAVPLITAGRTVGILIAAFDEPRNFSPEERDGLLNGGRRTAEAFVRAQAYEAAEHARRDAEAFRTRVDVELRERHKAESALRESETKYRALAARTNRLYELSAALSESITVEAVARAIVHHGKIALGASAGSVALLSQDRTRFEQVHGDEYGESASSGEGFAAEPGRCETEAVETRQPLFITSFADCTQRYWQSASLAASGGFASGTVLPLIVEDHAIGVLAFYFTAPVHFDHEYTAMLTSAAQHCAQATDRARLYETSQRARAEAEAANQSKDDFLSTVSHELRTPLTAVLGWASMLRAGSLDPARSTRAIEAIFNNATRQTHLIDELLDISRIVSGRVIFDRHELDLAEVLHGASEAVMPQADAKGVEFKTASHPSVPVVGDPRRLEQVFLNLLANALKFTPEGGQVTVDVTPGAHSVDVRVADNGAGIEPAFLSHVFDRFRQGDNSTARSTGGLGLGLFIARQLVEAQGGSIRAESDGPGRGAAFIVTLPVLSARAGRDTETPATDRAAAGDEAGGVMPTLTGIRVLVVDDEPDVRELMVAALEASGAAVTSVGSAGEALKILARAQVDVLLADLAMPGQDGYDLIKATRALPWPRAARIPAAAVTACARDDERERALAAGFQRHLSKPVRPEALVQTVAGLVRAS